MLTIIAGVPAVGKTTRVLGNKSFEFDDWVCRQYSLPVQESTYKYRKEYPDSNTKYLKEVCRAYSSGTMFLVDTFIYRNDRKIAVDFFKACGIVNVKLVYLVASLATVLHRNRSRERPINENIVFNMWVNQEFPSGSEGFSEVQIICTE